MYMHSKIRQLDIISEKSPDMMFTKMVCPGSNQKECMYRECIKCQRKNAVAMDNNTLKSEGKNSVQCYWQWQLVTEELGDRTIKKTKKVIMKNPTALLINTYNISMQKYITHVYNMKHQQYTCRMKKMN